MIQTFIVIFNPKQLKIKIMMLKIILITCLTSSLALHHQSSHQAQRHHFQQGEGQKLQSIEFQQQFTRLKDQVAYVSRTVDLKDADKYSFIIERCKEITSGINALRLSLLRNHLLIIPQNHICPGLTTFNRSQINRYIRYTEKRDRQLNLYYSTCADCQFIIPDISKMVDDTHAYFTLVNKTLNGDFCPNKTLNEIAKGIVNLNHTYFKSNVKAANWYYGSIAKSDYKILMFKRASSFNLTNCPIETPFVKFSQQRCFNCPPNSLFNLGNESCTSCSIDQFFNVDQGQCKYCSGNKEIVNNSIVCRLCVLSDSEIYNSTTGRCQKCNGSRYLDQVDHLCKAISCPPNLPRFNSATQLCESCGIFETGDPNDPTKCIKTNYVGICPPQTPFYDSNTHSCIVCPKDTHYSNITLSCQKGGS